jgi:hypothetical protein
MVIMAIIGQLAIGILDAVLIRYIVSMFVDPRDDAVIRHDRRFLMFLSVMLVFISVAFLPAFHGDMLVVLAAIAGIIMCIFCIGYQSVWLRENAKDD